MSISKKKLAYAFMVMTGAFYETAGEIQAAVLVDSLLESDELDEISELADKFMEDDDGSEE